MKPLWFIRSFFLDWSILSLTDTLLLFAICLQVICSVSLNLYNLMKIFLQLVGNLIIAVKEKSLKLSKE